jgi:hypothetical protein
MHALYTYEDSEDEKVDCTGSFAGTRPTEYWQDEIEASSIPDRSTRSVGSYTYSLHYHAGAIDPETVRHHHQESEYWDQGLRRLDSSNNESRKHTILIIWVIVSTFLLGFVVGHFIWVPQQAMNEVISNTEAPVSTTTTGE